MMRETHRPKDRIKRNFVMRLERLYYLDGRSQRISFVPKMVDNELSINLLDLFIGMHGCLQDPGQSPSKKNCCL